MDSESDLESDGIIQGSPRTYQSAESSKRKTSQVQTLALYLSHHHLTPKLRQIGLGMSLANGKSSCLQNPYSELGESKRKTSSQCVFLMAIILATIRRVDSYVRALK